MDDATGKYYFWNIKTNEVSWDNPIKQQHEIKKEIEIELQEHHGPRIVLQSKQGSKTIDPTQHYSQEHKTKRHLEHFFNYEAYEIQRNVEALNRKKTTKKDTHFRKQRDDIKRNKVLRKYGTDKK